MATVPSPTKVGDGSGPQGPVGSRSSLPMELISVLIDFVENMAVLNQKKPILVRINAQIRLTK